MKIRDTIVKPFGLQTSDLIADGQKHPDIIKYEQGEPDKKLLAVTTVVKYHKLLGKLYFFPVKFFHRLIVRKTTEGIIHGIEVETKMPNA